MFKKLKKKLKGDGKDGPSIPAASASGTNHHHGPTPVDSRVTAATTELEAAIRNEGLQKPDESMGDAVERMQREFVNHWKGREPNVDIRNPHDRITDLIFSGKSDKPKTDASAPNATATDRAQALIETGLENLLRPEQPPAHQILQLDPTCLEWYKYSQLKEPRSIRLVRFDEDQYELPDCGRQKICALETFQQAQAPAYLTLSYTWGAPRNDDECRKTYAEDREWFIRDGETHHRLKVTRNLHDALQQITQSKSSVRHLWIDALCINQDDLPERASQVSMMGDIYSRCTRVIVWLGSMDAREAARIWTLHFDILPEIIKYIGQNGVDSIKSGDWTEQDLNKRFDLAHPVRSDQWERYVRFFQSVRWFSRAWVVQEVALAPEVLVMFAHLQLAWADMVLLARFLRSSGLIDEILDSSDTGDSNDLRAGAILEVIHELRQSAGNMRNQDGLETMAKVLKLSDASRVSWKVFLDCITTLRVVQSTDPRDRIFAALGFLQLDGRYRGAILPDYQISVQELFTQVTTVLLSEFPGLEILTKRGKNSRRMKDLPTWVPDYTVASELPLHGDIVNAASYSKTPPSWNLQGVKLVLQGVPFTTVKAVHPWNIEDEIGGEHAGLLYSVKILHVCFNAVIHLTEKTVYNSDPLDVLWRTVTANQVSPAGNPAIDSSHFRAFMAQTILKMCDDMPAINSSLANLQPEGIGFRFPPSDSKPSADLLKFLQQTRRRVKTSLYPNDQDVLLLDALAKKASIFLTTALKYTTDCQLYVTEAGFVGLGPIAMKEGDIIMYVRDTPLIFAMRKREQLQEEEGADEYEMLGETYLHGFMNEELATTVMARIASDIVIV